MSDSSDIEWDDDDTLLEQRKQELLQQKQDQQDLGPTAHPAFLAQFDPKSPTYHGGHDAKPIAINNTGQMSVPKELQGQYGSHITSLHDLPDAHPDAPALNEDPTTFGELYATLYNLRENSLLLKKMFHRFQTLVTAYVRVVETYDCKIPHTPPEVESHLPHMTPQNLTRGQIRLEITRARDACSGMMTTMKKQQASLTAALTNPILVESRLVGPNSVSFNIPQHMKELAAVCDAVEQDLFANELRDHEHILATEHDLYYKMKMLSTGLTTEQAKMLQELKKVKKEYLQKKQKE